jgi:alanyl-tRNA synthetase
MLKMGDVSSELCGGTHVKNTSSIMDFKVIREESLQTGVRRITAKTGRGLRQLMHERYKMVGELCQTLKVPAEEVPSRIGTLLEDNKKLKKQIQSGPGVDLTGATQQLLDQAIKLGSATAIIGELPAAPVDKLRAQIDWIRKKAPESVVVIGSKDGEKVQLLAAVADNLIAKGLSAGKIIAQIAKIVDGGGGGRDQMAQAGGKNPAKLGEALEQAQKIVREKLS